jgi:hypothetical protein
MRVRTPRAQRGTRARLERAFLGLPGASQTPGAGPTLMNAPRDTPQRCYTCSQTIDDGAAVAVRLGMRSVQMCAPCAQVRFSVVVFEPPRRRHRSEISALKPEVFARQRGP